MSWRTATSTILLRRLAAKCRPLCWLLVAGATWAGCGPGSPDIIHTDLPGRTDGELKSSITYLIHGDGDYAYHDEDGNRFFADEVQFAKANAIAERCKTSEVFIFRQKRKSNFLFFFPEPDGAFSYYRAGVRIAAGTYKRMRDGDGLAREREIFREYSYTLLHGTTKTVFIYYGHEVPQSGGYGYHQTDDDHPFNLSLLGTHLDSLREISGGKRFDHVVLSTCFNGTPAAVVTLSSSASYIIASPENLHLSYLNSESLARLDEFNSDAEFASYFAEKAFERLSREVQTTVTVAVYDVAALESCLPDLKVFAEAAPDAKGNREYCDCAGIGLPACAVEGTRVFFRAPRFGRLRNVQSHSGWECISPVKNRESAIISR